jgi:hypothetical protein
MELTLQSAVAAGEKGISQQLSPKHYGVFGELTIGAHLRPLTDSTTATGCGSVLGCTKATRAQPSEALSADENESAQFCFHRILQGGDSTSGPSDTDPRRLL